MTARFDPRDVDVARMLDGLGLEARKDGDSWWAKCPSGRHEDRHPSFHVVDRRGEEKNGLGYCYSCKWGGSSVDVVRAVYGFAGTAEAVSWLMEKAVAPSTDIDRLTVRVASPTRAAFGFPPDVRFDPVEVWPATPRQYLEKRGVPATQAARWGVGYALEGRLRGRVVFPARGAQGQPTNYAARTFCGQLVRYLSASEGEGPDPDAVFGEHMWPRIDARRAVVVCEGALNALACELASGLPVAALFGSKVTLGQILKLSSFALVVAATDPDMAGDAASERIEAAFCRHAEVRRLRLPAGEDASSVGPEALRHLLEATLA